MAKTTKATKAAEAALDAAAAAAKDAKRLSKTLPKKDAKKLRALADDAKDASQASKKKVANHPRKVHKKAVAAIARVDKAVDKAEGKLAAAKKSAAKKGNAAPAKGAAKKSAKSGPAASKRVPIDVTDEVVETSIYAPSALQPTAAPEPPAAAAPAPPPSTEDLSSLTVLQLRARARDAGHAGFSRYTKAQLMALLSS